MTDATPPHENLILRLSIAIYHVIKMSANIYLCTISYNLQTPLGEAAKNHTYAHEYSYLRRTVGPGQTTQHNHAGITKGRQLDRARHSHVSIGLSVHHCDPTCLHICEPGSCMCVCIACPVCVFVWYTGRWYVWCVWDGGCLTKSVLDVILRVKF